ncbi:hypothetical protein Csa_008078 [Cucumis sativus]|uniref:Uncharacterized protein n=1 Tax=Cucumis sativus TaxID=3659 RepID=A0A0A0KVL4_CUCSA|nr:hypothetical protein Csa_008078 [Cucumis sativus]
MLRHKLKGSDSDSNLSRYEEEPQRQLPLSAKSPKLEGGIKIEMVGIRHFKKLRIKIELGQFSGMEQIIEDASVTNLPHLQWVIPISSYASCSKFTCLLP